MEQDGLTQDERLWAMLAHLSGFLGYAVVLGQYLAPLVIYLVYRDRSRFVAFHALQQLFFQLALLLLWVPVIIVAIITCGLGTICALVPALLSLIIPLLAAIYAYNGEWYEIPLIGSMTRGMVTG